jgi:multiple sugar transport system substrate-binding protein
VKELHEELAQRFSKLRPDVQIRFRTPPNGYAPLTEQILRAAVVNNAPDVVFEGLNFLRTLSERHLTVSLGSFAEKDGGFKKLGYHDWSLALGRLGRDAHGLPFAISIPVIYVNGDLVKSAGHDPANIPTTWAELVKIGKAVEAKNPGKTGFFYRDDVDGNWMLQALVFSNAGAMLNAEENRVAFVSGPGRFALDTLEFFAREKMVTLNGSQARSAFGAGNIAIFADSSSNIESISRAVGDRFDYRIARFPMPSSDGKLPAGGNLAVMLAKDPKKQDAAWEYIKFVTGPVGQTLMATRTGYLPGNEIPMRDQDMLGRFLSESPKRALTAQQLPFLTGWYAYPGANALKITDVIQDHVDSVVAGRQSAEAAAQKISSDVDALLAQSMR